MLLFAFVVICVCLNCLPVCVTVIVVCICHFLCLVWVVFGILGWFGSLVVASVLGLCGQLSPDCVASEVCLLFRVRVFWVLMI